MISYHSTWQNQTICDLMVFHMSMWPTKSISAIQVLKKGLYSTDFPPGVTFSTIHKFWVPRPNHWIMHSSFRFELSVIQFKEEIKQRLPCCCAPLLNHWDIRFYIVARNDVRYNLIVAFPCLNRTIILSGCLFQEEARLSFTVSR